MKRKNERYNEGYKTENESKNHKKTMITLIAIILVSLIVLLVVDNKVVGTQAQKAIDVDNKVEAKELEDFKLEQNEKEVQLAQKRIDLIAKNVNQIVGINSNYYGIIYYDLDTDTQYTLNADAVFHAASTIKVPIAMMVEDKIRRNEFARDTKIEYEQSDYSDGAGVLQGAISIGDEYPVEELLNYMIKDSDNIATSMLKKSVGNISSYISTATGISVNSDNNFITPKQSCLLLKKIYDEADINKEYRNITEMMLNTSTHDRLDKYIPRNIVAHKIGDYENYINDVGIIYAKRPYILCIYTKGMMEQGREDIAEISKTVYDIVATDKL